MILFKISTDEILLSNIQILKGMMSKKIIINRYKIIWKKSARYFIN